MRRRFVILIALCVICPLVAAMSVVSFNKKSRERKIETVRYRQDEVMGATYQLYLENCSGFYPEPDVDIPTQLTTPYAYTKAENTLDPFGKNGETMLLFPGRYFSNGSSVAIASRGPDGDLDCKRLPKVSNYYTPVQLEAGTEYEDWNVKVKTQNKENEDELLQQVVRHKNQSGVWIENSGIPILTLPGYEKKFHVVYTEKQLRDWMTENGVFQYDPTNGARSDGDLMMINP